MSASGKLMSLDAALAALLAQADAEPALSTEILALAAAEGRILAQEVLAPIDLPPWPNSAMDGYALRLADWTGEPLPVSQRIFAGSAPLPLEPGTCARIFTGAPMPAGADTVEMQENAELLADGRVRFLEPLRLGRNIRPQAGEARRGEAILPADTRLGPVELALIASLGVSEVKVRRRLRVALLSTGDEIVEPGQPLGPGKIYNSNRYLLRACLQRLGCEVLDHGILPDSADAVRQRLGAVEGADLILTSGGVSVGEADYLGQVLKESGELILWKLAIKPGKPLTCARYGGVPVIGLPGNPGAALVTFALLARPYLLRRSGVQQVEPLGVPVPAGFDWPKPGSRREFLHVRIDGGQALPHPNQSSAVLRSAAWAEGLLELPENLAFERGHLLRFLPYAALFG